MNPTFPGFADAGHRHLSQDRRDQRSLVNIWGENPQHGFALGFVNGSTGDSSGFSWAFFYNYADSYTGVEWSIVNYSQTSFVGWQAGMVNYSEEFQRSPDGHL